MKRILAIALLMIITACAHHKDVRPGENGIHRVAFQVEDKNEGAREAMEQASHYCEQFNKSPVVVNEGSKYTGDVSENTYKVGKTASKILGAGGAAGVVLASDKKTKRAGMGTSMGGGMASSVLGEGYTFEMTFKCQ